MKCWKCGLELAELTWGKLSFRAICDGCFSSLHCCNNCVHHKLGAPNECLIPGTPRIVDRSAANFCEDFKVKGTGPVKSGDPKAAARRLFKDEDNENDETDEDPKKKFDRLF